MSKLVIYKASAGSGKTFALTHEYLHLLYDGGAERSVHASILAVTFTNKATTEMKMRILKELHALASGKPSPYLALLQKEFSLTEAEVRARAVTYRTAILHDFSRLSVTNIDKFFLRIQRAFLHEMGIHPLVSVQLDHTLILSEAVDMMLSRLENRPELKRWLLDLTETALSDKHKWSVNSQKNDILKLGAQLFRERFLMEPVISSKAQIKALSNELYAIIRGYENHLVALGEEGIALLGKYNLQATDFKGKSNSFATNFTSRLLAKRDDFTKAFTTLSAVEDIISLKTPAETEQRICEAFDELASLVEKVLTFTSEEKKRYLSAKVTAENLYLSGILSDLKEEVARVCEERHEQLLLETTHLLNALIANNETPFIYEKSGNWFHHILIDEFQDTSALQWKNFSPMVINVLSENGRAVVVGDVKQSIYRFRNGDWSLLDHKVEEEMRQFGVKNEKLDNNWRSGERIVSFNNRFFELASETVSEWYNHDSVRNDESIKKIYKDVAQKPQKEGGYVEIQVDIDTEELLLERLIGAIADEQSHGRALSRCAVLVSTAKEAKRVAEALSAYNQTAEKTIPYISGDALLISASPAVQLLVLLLRHLFDPSDTAALAGALRLYHTLTRKEEASFDYFRTIDPLNPSMECFTTAFAERWEKGFFASLYETVEAMIDLLNLQALECETCYLLAFQQTLFDFSQKQTATIPLFLQWWEENKESLSLPATEQVEGVRILTIHKSKGAEFDYLFLPFVDWDMDDTASVRNPSLLWVKSEKDPFNQLDYTPVSYKSALADTYFSEAYWDERLLCFIDSLNKLYVAFTRASRALYILPLNPQKSKQNVAHLIYETINAMAVEEGMPAPSENEPLRFGVREPDEVAARLEVPSLKSYSVYPFEERLTIGHIPALPKEETVELSPIDEGLLLHRLMQLIRYKGDEALSVDQLILSGEIRLGERSRYVEALRNYLSHEEMSRFFKNDLTVVNERDLWSPVTGTFLRPDRVVIDDNRNVTVIDYKSGQRRDAYRFQIDEYCRSLHSMGYPEVTGYLWYLRTGEIEKCVIK